MSGYVSILLGRTRGTEDVDILIEKIAKKTFSSLCAELLKKSFWCLNGKDSSALYDDYLKKNAALRFAEKNTVQPNIELKFVKNEVDINALEKPAGVFVGRHVFLISPLEQQIAYKKCLLGTPKDMEDARHLEKLFKGSINSKELKRHMMVFKKWSKSSTNKKIRKSGTGLLITGPVI